MLVSWSNGVSCYLVGKDVALYTGYLLDLFVEGILRLILLGFFN